jgi:hypothetical protein
MRRLDVTALALLTAALATGCGESETPEASRPVVSDPGPVHVHGLGVNPKDGALFIATHTGLFRAPRDERKARRVADRYQDTMGFTVVGPDRFLGSGHPDGREKLPPFLGLIESVDAGETWKEISLQGEADFHVLEARGERVYGFGSNFQTRREHLLVSDDGGRRWEQRSTPESLIALAMDPKDPTRVVASSERALYASDNAGRGWKRLDGPAGLLAWPAPERRYVVTADGRVHVSDGDGGVWRRSGEIEGQPAAFEAEGPDELYVALHDGTIKRSTDGGATWNLRSTP